MLAYCLKRLTALQALVFTEVSCVADIDEALKNAPVGNSNSGTKGGNQWLPPFFYLSPRFLWLSVSS